MSSISSSLLKVFYYLLLILIIPVLTVFSLTFINRNTKALLCSLFGNKAQVYFGGLGVIVHETSHLLLAILFGHQIRGFKPLKFPSADDSDLTLGYVSHSWNDKSLYQSIGNLFIGTAPIWGCTLALIFLTRVFVPKIFNAISYVTRQAFYGDQTVSQLVHLLVASFLPSSFSFTSLLGVLIWIALSVNITVGGFDLSNADLKGAGHAFVLTYLICAAILFILVYCGFSMLLQFWLIRFCIWFILVMLMSFFWSILANLVLRAIALFGGL